MVKVVVIKFKNGGKLYYFAPKEGDVYERNMPVVVETSKGLEYAWVAYPEREVEDDEVVQPLKPIIRIATQKDREFYAQAEAKKPQAMQTCREKIAKHGLEMKLVDCEYAFDGSKIVFFFTSAGRVDFRELVNHSDYAGPGSINGCTLRRAQINTIVVCIGFSGNRMCTGTKFTGDRIGRSQRHIPDIATCLISFVALTG